MKKLICIMLTVCTLVSLVACGKNPGATESDVFKPALDTQTTCNITVAGEYKNFEALEAEFDKFNDYYPNVKFKYVRLDDYNNTLATALEGNDKPNIFFSYTWMLGNETYDAVVEHMEDLSDPALKLDLDCIRTGLVNRDEKGVVKMVPVFSRTYGMLVNNDLFKKEGLKVPTTLEELSSVCAAFKSKGYISPMMGYSAKSSSCFMYTVAYPLFVATLAKNSQALALANSLDPAAGEYMRPALNAVDHLLKNGYIDLDECNKIADNYEKVIMRFFKGDVPMMICAGDTASGTKKRESQSEEFSASPFAYSFAPIPMSEGGGYFIDSPSIEFSVNKDCNDLDMTNEFMRFLVTDKELNAMASVKGLVTPTKELSLDSIYAPFANISSERTISPEVLGIKDKLTVQIRVASYKVGKSEMTIDEAVANYGSFE